MELNKEDPRLMDYVLGELDTDEARAIESALQLPQNAEALRETEALRGVVQIAAIAMDKDMPTLHEGLSPTQRESVLAQAAHPMAKLPQPRRWQPARWLAVAAAIALCAAAAMYGIPRHAQRGHLHMAAEHTVDLLTKSVASEIPAEIEGQLKELGYSGGNASQGLAQPAPSLPPASPPPAQLHIASIRVEDRLEQVADGISTPGVPLAAQDVSGQLQQLGYFGQEPGREDKSLCIAPAQSQYYSGGERYTEIAERPFTRADETPLSTFSLHPDTAAYTNVRRFLQQGQRPPKDAVRIEELLNYFDYAYPQPDGRHPFSVNIEVGPCPWASGQLLAKIGVQGRRVAQEERPPANLVFLIDVSGSMSGANRLPLVKESMKALVDELRPDDHVGIVTYAGNSAIALRVTAVGEGRDRITRAIEMLQAGGSTHGSAGIQDAYAMAQRNFIKEGINRVILATDGDFNVGVQSREGLLALIEEKRQTGVFLTVLGYGMGNLKDGMLELLASKGNGNYAYIDTYREARRVLIEQLSGTLMTIAKDAKIQVEFNPAQVRAYRLIGFENRMLAARDFHDDTKDAGEIGAGHSVTALYQIVPHGVAIEPGVDPLRYQEAETPPKPEPAREGEMMFVKLRYKQPDQDASELLQIPVAAQAASLNETTSDYRFAASVAGFGLLLRDSAYKGEATYDMVRQMAAAALNNDARREEFLDLVVTAKTLAGQ